MPNRYPILDAATRRRAISSKVRVQMAILGVIFLAITGLVVYRVTQGGVALGWVVATFAVGLVVGVLLARSHPLGLSAEAEVVVTSLTIFGVAVLAAYIVILLVRNDVLAAVIRDSRTAGAAGLAITSGVMVGRFLAQVRQIRHLLTQAGILPGPPAPATGHSALQDD